MITLTLTFEFEEEELKEIFEEAEIKFSKKKAKEIKSELLLSDASNEWTSDFHDDVREFLVDYIRDYYE